MDEREMEKLVMELVVNGGDARSKALEAIREAGKGNFSGAEELFNACDEALNRAHSMQTDLIQKEAAGRHTPVSLFLIHAQDHLMNAMTVKDLAVEIVHLLKEKQV